MKLQGFEIHVSTDNIADVGLNRRSAAQFSAAQFSGALSGAR